MGRQHDDLAVVPWYWRDWRASKARALMTPAARGIYRELLDSHYGEAACSLPNDDAELAAMAGVTLEEWLAVKPQLERWLPPNDEGRLQNPRAYHEWSLARKKRGVVRRKRRAAANERWRRDKERRKGASKGDASALQKECPPTPTATPTPTPSASAAPSASAGAVTDPPSPPAREGWPSQKAADVFLRHYPDGKPEPAMFKILRPLVLKRGWEAVEPELDAYLAATDVRFHSWPKFAAGFGTWSGSPLALSTAAPQQNRFPTMGERAMAEGQAAIDAVRAARGGKA